jgi:tetratricopeptide (TPR) repeat protein
VSAALERVEQLRLLGRLDDAERAAREALAAEPEDAALLTALAAVLCSAGRHAEGLEAVSAATAAAPEAERSHRLRALLLSAVGRHQEAVDAAYRSVTFAPEEPYTGIAYAQVLQRAGRLAAAEQAARQVVSLDPECASAHFLLADIASDRGNRAVARRAYEETLRIDPQHAAARHDLAVLDARRHRPALALRGLVEAGMLEPGMPQVLYTVAQVLWQLSWRLRMVLVVSTVAVIMAAGPEPTDATWATRIAAAVALAVMGLLIWWTVRDLPRQTWPVARAAVRTGGPLRFTYLAVAACLLLFLAVVVSGFGLLAAVVWLVLGLLGVLALAVRVVRSMRRS